MEDGEKAKGIGRGATGGGGDPFSDRDRKSGERRRGLRGTEVGVVTERMSEHVCVCGRTSSAAVETVRRGLQFLVLMGEQWRDVIKAL